MAPDKRAAGRGRAGDPAGQRAPVVCMANRKSGQPVRSLRYFETSLQEVFDGDWPKGYWKHVRAQLRRCEEDWR